MADGSQLRQKSNKETPVKLMRAFTVAMLLLYACTLFAQSSADEESVWKLEHSYWEDVKALDLVSYLGIVAPEFCWLAVRQCSTAEQ